jgi:hypothetical protein
VKRCPGKGIRGAARFQCTVAPASPRVIATEAGNELRRLGSRRQPKMRSNVRVGLRAARFHARGEWQLGSRLSVSGRRREGPESAHRRQPSDRDALDFIEADLIAPTIVELRRARRRMVRHGRGLLERAAVFQIGRDSGCPEAVVAELGFDAGCGRTPADHCVPRIL